MLRHDGAKHLVSSALLKRNVAALLSKHAKAGALESANEAFPEILGSRVMLFCDFDEGPERLLRCDVRVGSAPGFEVQLDGLAQIGSRGFHVCAL